MKSKLCKICSKEIPRGLRNTCSQKCENKKIELREQEKKKIAKEKKKVSVAVLKKKLWTLFSEYIRKSEAVGEIGNCVTCGVEKHWKELQAGHFVPAGSSNYLRFVEANVHSQCYSCNCHKHSNPIEYRIWMVNKYGEKFVEQLVSLRNVEKKFTSQELQDKIDEYKDKLSKL